MTIPNNRENTKIMANPMHNIGKFLFLTNKYNVLIVFLRFLVE